MSDSRYHLEIKLQIYGQDFELNSSQNWFAEQGKIPELITDWFRECYNTAEEKHERSITKTLQDVMEKKELEELERLKNKYPNA